MKKITIAGLFFFFLSNCSSIKIKNEISSFDWLIGKWERTDTKPGQTAFETWIKTSSTELTGEGILMKNGEIVFTEKLSLVRKDSKMYYVALPQQNNASTFFEITTILEQGFIAENPEHDFPKKIIYQLEGKLLTATISGNGKTIPFYFKKGIP